MKKRESQSRSTVGDLERLKLKVVVLHDSIGKEIHMTQLVGFVTTDMVIVA